MKRSKELESLSWEHHDGLVDSFRIKQGVKKEVPCETLSNYIRTIWEQNLQHHFEQEEQVLIPLLSKAGDSGELLPKFWQDHQELARMAESLQTDPATCYQRVAAFAERLEQHIRFEERELFPWIETELDAETLASAGSELHKRHLPACHTWQDAFWKND